MEKILSSLKIEVNPLIFLKNPESSDLGKKILSAAVLMIDEMGMEQFTFGKLAKVLGTTESSIYRYFESKHKLLLYFYNWYWEWIEYQIVFSTKNVTPSENKLKIALNILCMQEEDGYEEDGISLVHLKNIVISESSKAYLNKEVDEENKAGFFLAFKKVAKRLVSIIYEIDPDYSYPNTLIATCLEGILHQQYFARHLPSLSDVCKDTGKLPEIFYQIIINNLNQKN